MLAGPAGCGAEANTFPWVKLVNTKMSSTAGESGSVPKFVGMKLELNPSATWCASGNDRCRSVRVDAYFRCDVQRRLRRCRSPPAKAG